MLGAAFVTRTYNDKKNHSEPYSSKLVVKTFKWFIVNEKNKYMNLRGYWLLVIHLSSYSLKPGCISFRASEGHLYSRI